MSTRDLFGALLKAAGDLDETFLPLAANPKRSASIMQSFWYDHRGRTQPRYRDNQFAFVAGEQRFAHRHGQWRTAPLREAVDRPERLASTPYVRVLSRLCRQGVTPSSPPVLLSSA
jgi:hypothetical protein